MPNTDITVQTQMKCNKCGKDMHVNVYIYDLYVCVGSTDGEVQAEPDENSIDRLLSHCWDCVED
jgi:hypothetical protein